MCYRDHTSWSWWKGQPHNIYRIYNFPFNKTALCSEYSYLISAHLHNILMKFLDSSVYVKTFHKIMRLQTNFMHVTSKLHIRKHSDHWSWSFNVNDIIGVRKLVKHCDHRDITRQSQWCASSMKTTAKKVE